MLRAYYSQCSRNLVFPMTPESCSSTYQLGILAFSKSKLYYMQEFGEKVYPVMQHILAVSEQD